MGLAGKQLTNAQIALFDNKNYVDNFPDNGSGDSEVRNIKASLRDRGHDVLLFGGKSAAAMAAALDGKDVVVIPELEKGSLTLSNSAADVLRDFVATGHTLIINGADGDSDTDFLNSVFGFMVNNGLAGALTRNDSAAAGTSFADDKSSLSDNDAIYTLNAASLPGDALNIYSNGDNAGVVVFPYGGGQIVFLAYDWYDAAPRGVQNGGWLKALASAVSLVSGPGVEITGTSGDDIVNDHQTVAGQPLPTIRGDRIFGNGGSDTLSGLAGNDDIIGGGGKDVIFGGRGDDLLRGGSGADELTGGKGKDQFIFDSAGVLNSVDKIDDMTPGKDKIVLDPQILVGLPTDPGELPASAFHIGSAATKGSQRIIYNDANGKLYFDPDGKGDTVKVHFADLDPHLALTHADFEIMLFA